MDTASETEATDLVSSMARTWISMKEAREQSFGTVQWWKIEGPYGEVVEEKQYCSGAPTDRPVLLYDNGDMYFGQWGKSSSSDELQWKGFGVFCRSDGFVSAGYWKDFNGWGPSKDMWLPSSPIWQENVYPESAIKSQPDTWLMASSAGLPYIYLGCNNDDMREDLYARVILKDGQTRTGPWKNGKPVGDWWESHEKSITSPEQIARLLFPTSPQQVTEPGVVPNGDGRYAQPKDGKAMERRKRQVYDIAKWLADDVIGFDADMDDMRVYGRELRDWGFHSVEMVEEVCTKADVSDFEWMEPMHKRLFLRALSLEKG